MRSLVVLLALVAAACGSAVPALWAQPAHHPATVLDPHGRPLDTAPVLEARALHLQAKALEGHHGYPLVHAAPLVSIAAPVWGAHSIATPWIGAHGHLLKKRSLAHATYLHSAPIVHAAPITHAIAPAAVSHQSRVDVISSPAVHAVAAPAVVAHAAPAVIAAPVVVAAPSAVSHQSRVDVHSSPAVVAHSVYAAPALSAHSLWGAHSAHGLPLAAHAAHGLSAHGHWLKKRSLGLWGHAVAPSAVSHQSRVDVISSPAVVSHAVAAPVLAHAAPVIAHAAPVVAHIAPAAVSHVSRVDVHSSPAVVAHHAIAPIAPIAPLAHSVHAVPAWSAHHGLHGLHGSPLVHAW